MENISPIEHVVQEHLPEVQEHPPKTVQPVSSRDDSHSTGVAIIDFGPFSPYKSHLQTEEVQVDNSTKIHLDIEEMPSKEKVQSWLHGIERAEFAGLGSTFGTGMDNNVHLPNIHLSNVLHELPSKGKLQTCFDAEFPVIGETFGSTSLLNDNNARGTKRAIALATWKWDEVIDVESSHEFDLDDHVEDCATSKSPPRKIPKVTIQKRHRVLRLRDESDDEDVFAFL